MEMESSPGKVLSTGAVEGIDAKLSLTVRPVLDASLSGSEFGLVRCSSFDELTKGLASCKLWESVSISDKSMLIASTCSLSIVFFSATPFLCVSSIL